ALHEDGEVGRGVSGGHLVEELPPYAHTHGDYPAGLPALRAMIAERYTVRGIPTMPEQIMVTTGAMGAIDAICHLFGGRGERIAVESPSYANILQLMREAGARLVPVAMAEGLTGWDVDRWRQVLRDAAPRIAYVVADFHNPTGALADDDQRRRLVDAARSAGTVLVADETMSELWLDDVEMPRPVCAFDPAGSTVITVGSASKAFWAGMRIGWVRAAPDVIRSLVGHRTRGGGAPRLPARRDRVHRRRQRPPARLQRRLGGRHPRRGRRGTGPPAPGPAAPTRLEPGGTLTSPGSGPGHPRTRAPRTPPAGIRSVVGAAVPGTAPRTPRAVARRARPCAARMPGRGRGTRPRNVPPHPGAGRRPASRRAP
ncbi:aminotransferase class I/II-fold pyridoxal phosphate-dependent enzyme, partial [Streptomyces tendae]